MADKRQELRYVPSKTNVNVSVISGQPLHQQKTGDLKDANFPKDAEGRTYHLGCKRGEIANRIITVGDPRRAERLAALFDDAKDVWRRASNRGFVVYTGRKHNVPVSIIATGMGYPMIDFMLREARNIVEGPIAILRFGTCGGIEENIPIGSVVVHSKGAVSIRRNPDAFRAVGGDKEKPYIISKPVTANAELSKSLLEHMRKALGEQRVFEGMDAMADSFYSSQGRQDAGFRDQNVELIHSLRAEVPAAVTLEMETFHLLDLAECSREPIFASSSCIVLAHRVTNAFLDNATLAKIEAEGGRATLMTLVSFELQGGMNDDECVWNQKIDVNTTPAH